jgi:hypothetical protein
MIRRRIAGAALLVLLVACKGHDAVTPPADGGDDAAPAVETVTGPGADAAAPPADAKKVIAIASPAPIFSATEYPPKDPEKANDDRKGVTRLGYVRNGESVPVKPDVIKKANCPEGWWELLEGGFICGKFVTDDPNHPELANGKGMHPPLDDGPLPYQYGLNLTNGAPLYRRIP